MTSAAGSPPARVAGANASRTARARALVAGPPRPKSSAWPALITDASVLHARGLATQTSLLDGAHLHCTSAMERSCEEYVLQLHSQLAMQLTRCSRAVLDRLGYDIEQPRTSIKLILSASSLILRAGLGYQLWRYGTSLASPLDWRCVMTLCMFRSLRVPTPVTTPVTLQTQLKCARLPPPRVLLPHTCTQDGWFLQPKRRPARFPRRTVPSNCICRCSRMRARLPLPRVLLPHTCTQDGWFLQPKRRPARLPRRTVPSNCICRCSRMRARLPLHILLLHTQVSQVSRAPLLLATLLSHTIPFPRVH
jgi:hypothetical protein